MNKKTKNRLRMLKESSYNETTVFLNKTFLKEGSDRSWPRGL